MKRLLSAALAAITVLLSFGTVYASDALYCYNSDIVAYIDGKPIKSYNIEGNTGIVAEDLYDYKFRVNYWDAYRLLVVNYVKGDRKEYRANYVPEPLDEPVGSIAGQIYPSDISVRVGSTYVKGYNIGGKTIILLDELKEFGEVVWNPEKRTISYSYKDSWSISPQKSGETESGNIDAFSLDVVNGGEGTFSVSGKGAYYFDGIKLENSWNGGLVFGFSVLQRSMNETAELRRGLDEISTVGYDGAVLRKGYDSDRIKVLLNGNEVGIKELRQTAGNGNFGYRFTLDVPYLENADIVEKLHIEFK